MHVLCMYTSTNLHMLAHLAAGGQLPQRDEAGDINQHELKEAGIHQRCHQGLLVEYFALHARLLHVRSKCEFCSIQVCILFHQSVNASFSAASRALLR